MSEGERRELECVDVDGHCVGRAFLSRKYLGQRVFCFLTANEVLAAYPTMNAYFHKSMTYE